jgi:hypothetical protein
MNTAIIITAQVAIGDDGNTYAARICNELQITEGGKTYGDWYLPSMHEFYNLDLYMDLINAAAVAHGGSAFSGSYWTSTEISDSRAHEFSFPIHAWFSQTKDSTYPNVRAIRAF